MIHPIHSVVIIGAGLSGLSAAVRLSAANISTVVLDAQSYPGGRVRTAQHPTLPRKFELGATWFHGTKGNAAFELAVSNGLLKQQDVCDGKEEDIGVLIASAPAAHVSADGRVQTLEKEMVLEIARKYADAFEEIEAGVEKARPNVSVQQCVRDKLEYSSMSPLQQAAVRCRESLDCAVNGCDSTADLSAALVGDFKWLPGDNVEASDGGMAALVSVLVGMLGETVRMRLEAEVKEVCWGTGKEADATVRLVGGDVLSARCVIWTPSVNVTKRAISDEVFKPALPDEKVRAYAGRGQGAVEKVFAMLREPLDGITPNTSMPVLWEEDGENSSGAQKDWHCGVFSLTYSDSLQAVTMWLCGEHAKSFCQLPITTAREQTEALISQVYQRTVSISSVVRSEWSTDIFTQGSYSFPQVGGNAEDISLLKAPLPSSDQPVLCFAGEATHERFYSTMHGAIETGYREAERCIEFLGRMGNT